MISSMTGYGRAEGETALGHLVVELKSVNHRFLDSRVRSPRQLSCLETPILAELKNSLARGRVEVNLTLSSSNTSANQPVLNVPLAQQFRQAVSDLARDLDLPDEVSVEFILGMPDVLQAEDTVLDPEEVWNEVRPIFNGAIAALGEMRAREGEVLAEDFRKTLVELEDHRVKLEDLKQHVVEEYRERLHTRLKTLLPENGGLDVGRLHQEVALFADRCDISEELARLASHLQQFGEILDVPEPVGRRLDFLLQEMFREVNTIGSKANHLEIKQISLEMKNCVEKLREQTQNVE